MFSMKRTTAFRLLLGLGAVVTAIVILEKNNDYAPTKQVNPRAPAQTRQVIQIVAPPEKVWQLLSQVNEWSTWQTDIKAPHLNGPLQAGTSFDWGSGGLRIHSTLHTVEPLTRIGWSGTAFGSFAVHNWTLTLLPNGHTEVRVDEGMEGWLVQALWPLFQRGLDSSIALWLARLKQAAEKP